MADAPRVAAQLDDLRLQGVGRLGRLPVAPELVDQLVGTDRTPSAERQKCQKGPLFGAPDTQRHPRLQHLQLAEELHLHVSTLRPMTRKSGA